MSFLVNSLDFVSFAKVQPSSKTESEALETIISYPSLLQKSVHDFIKTKLCAINILLISSVDLQTKRQRQTSGAGSLLRDHGPSRAALQNPLLAAR